MNKNIFIGIVIVILLGGGYFYFSKSPASPIKKATSGLIKGNIQSLFEKGTNMTCTFKYLEDANTSEGTIYVSGKKMRGNFLLTQSDGTKMQSNVLQDGAYGYTWIEGQEQGTKIKVEASEKKEDLFALDDKNIDYDCKPWSVDSNLFNAPTNVKFQDLSAQIEKIKETTEQFNQSKCTACNNAPAGTAREQCLQALGCN